VMTASGAENVPAKFDLGVDKLDFYRRASGILGTVTLGSKPNNQQVFTVTFVNEKARDISEIVYFSDSEYTQEFTARTFNGFDGIDLPKYASVTVTIDGSVYTEHHNVIWKSVEGYSVPTAENQNVNQSVKATAWIGDPIYGYIPDIMDLTVFSERIINYSKPTKISVNPYGDIMTQLNSLLGLNDGSLLVTTNLRSNLYLEVKYQEMNFPYTGVLNASFPLSVGTTVNFGGVEKIVDSLGNTIHTIVDGKPSIEVRQELPQIIDVKERVAVGMKTWYGSSDLTGSVYEPIDFTSLGTCTVVAISNRMIDSGIITDEVSSFAQAINGATRLDSNLWPEITKTWDEEITSTRLKGSIVSVYFNSTSNTYYIFYRGSIDLESVDYLNGADAAGYTFSDVVAGDEITRKHSAKLVDGLDFPYIVVDVAQFEEGITVTFETGAEEKYPLVWSADTIRYSFLGGRYNISATLASGHPTLEQTFSVPVYVLPSKLESLEVTGSLGAESIVITDNNKITELIVDPYVGFEGLPSTAIAIFEGGTNKLELSVEWDYSKIVGAMTTAGGVFNRENNMSALASIYVRNIETGRMEAIQTVEVPVTVLDRTLQGIYVSRQAEGPNFEEYMPAININPYVTNYSEDFLSPDFAFYRRVIIVVKKAEGENFTNNYINNAYKEIVCNLSGDNYTIRDTRTGRATDTTDLYTGRLIDASLTFGPTGSSVAKDAKYNRTIITTIQDMTYESGLPIAYFIDPYGIREGEEVTETGYTGLGLTYSVGVNVFDSVVEPTVETVTVPGITITSASGNTFTTDVVYDRKDIFNIFEGGRISRQVDAAGGITRLYAKIGNDSGGYQTKVIEVHYQDRTINRLFDVTDSPRFASMIDKTGADVPLHFVFDPFETYSKDLIFPKSSVNT
ncbi:MAG: hypothetical protein PHG90_02545, partial [Clostridia bacterium]|nr:hypothetical protein [Clostridia bacterium]